MASCLEEDLCCPVCQEIFKDPVLLRCSHSLCKTCLQSWWREKQTRECPVCRAACQWSEPPCNLALRNLCEAFLQDQRAPLSSLCSLHSERLKLFCLDHQQAACIICRDAKVHTDHRFRPIDEVAREHREELQRSLIPLREKFKDLNELRLKVHQTVEHIKVQSQRAARQIKEQFKKLHHFLQEEEEARMAALQEEEKQKSRVMKEKIEALGMEVAALFDTIRATEEKLRDEDVAFLRSYKALAERVQLCPLAEEPQLFSGMLMDMAKHLGNLSFNIWHKMKGMASYSPVVLDPNTANAELFLSEDLTSVRHGKRRQLPDNPERFEYWDAVLGTKGFNSGTHSWDVEVGEKKDWEVGVLAESASRRGFVGSTVWSVEYSNAGYRTYSLANKYTDLRLREKVKKIRVHLDWDAGRLSFSEPETDTHIHTFIHTFTEKLLPYLCTRNTIPLRVVPVDISVTLQN
ncbi:nuclear factor 7, brain-like [Pholidichthys leucotaenia]